MELINNFIMEIGLSPAFATSYINAFCGTLLMMTIIILHKWYIAIKAMNEIPEEELTEDNKDITIKQLMDKYWCKKKIGLVCCLSYLIIFVANYIVISKL